MEDRTEDNFGSEAARGYLAIQTARLLSNIREVVKDDDRIAPDEDGESLLMPAVELMALLCERYDAEPPRVVMVKQWHAKYIAAFDAAAGNMGYSHEFEAARRKVIDNTFRWLEGLAESYHSE